MLQLLQAPTEGYGDAIGIPAILAENFELKVGLLSLVTLSQFHGSEWDDAHSHILLMNKATRQATVKAIEETCVTCGGPHTYYECLAIDGNTVDACAAVGTYNQGGNGYRPQADPNYHASNQMGPPGFPPPNAQTVVTATIIELEECLALADLSASINLMPLFIWKKLSLSKLTPTSMTLKLANRLVSYSVFVAKDIFVQTFLRTPDELSNLDDDYYDTEGDIFYLENLLNEDTSLNLPSIKNEDLKQVDVTMTKPSIKEPPELELKDLPSHLEYAFLEGTNKLPVIISRELKDEEKSILLKFLKSHKRAIAWKISDIKGIDPRFCTHKMLMEDDFKPTVNIKEG
nr:reverse transcriptase domain-containing protein [Tanacetum cinerariifolium]